MHLTPKTTLHKVLRSQLLLASLLIVGCASTDTEKGGKSVSIPMPSAGKSRVVFVRANKEGGPIDFGVHDGDVLVGKLRDKTYFVYDCAPGHHVFSSSFGNLMILNADLSPDRIYYVHVRGQLRAWGPMWIKMDPIYPGCPGEQSWEKLPRTLGKLREYTVTSAEVEHDLKGIEKYKERMKKYESDPEANEKLLADHGQQSLL